MNRQHIHIFDGKILKETGYTCWKCYEADQERMRKEAERYEQRVTEINDLLLEIKYLELARKQIKSLLRRARTTPA